MSNHSYVLSPAEEDRFYEIMDIEIEKAAKKAKEYPNISSDLDLCYDYRDNTNDYEKHIIVDYYDNNRYYAGSLPHTGINQYRSCYSTEVINDNYDAYLLMKDYCEENNKTLENYDITEIERDGTGEVSVIHLVYHRDRWAMFSDNPRASDTVYHRALINGIEVDEALLEHILNINPDARLTEIIGCEMSFDIVVNTEFPDIEFDKQYEDGTHIIVDVDDVTYDLLSEDREGEYVFTYLLRTYGYDVVDGTIELSSSDCERYYRDGWKEDIHHFIINMYCDDVDVLLDYQDFCDYVHSNIEDINGKYSRKLKINE